MIVLMIAAGLLLWSMWMVGQLPRCDRLPFLQTFLTRMGGLALGLAIATKLLGVGALLVLLHLR